jgi:hypothetical protein
MLTFFNNLWFNFIITSSNVNGNFNRKYAFTEHIEILLFLGTYSTSGNNFLRDSSSEDYFQK